MDGRMEKEHCENRILSRTNPIVYKHNCALVWTFCDSEWSIVHCVLHVVIVSFCMSPSCPSTCHHRVLIHVIIVSFYVSSLCPSPYHHWVFLDVIIVSFCISSLWPSPCHHCVSACHHCVLLVLIIVSFYISSWCPPVCHHFVVSLSSSCPLFISSSCP